MPNYFDYIVEASNRYDEPDFIEESVNDSFDETIADMDLHCFQESLLVGAVVVGALALIGILIVVIKKIIKGNGSNSGLKKEAEKMEKAVDSLSNKGVREIRTGAAAQQTINSSGERSETPSEGGSTNTVTVIEEILCDTRKNVLNILDINGETFKNGKANFKRFVSGTITFFEYAIIKKRGQAENSKHMPDTYRVKSGIDNDDSTKGFTFNDIINPLSLPNMSECCIDKDIISIDALRDYAGKLKTELVPELTGMLKDLENCERKLKKHGENNDRVFANKQSESTYKKNVSVCNKFCTGVRTIVDRNIITLEKYNGSARFVGLAH